MCMVSDVQKKMLGGRVKFVVVFIIFFGFGRFFFISISSVSSVGVRSRSGRSRNNGELVQRSEMLSNELVLNNGLELQHSGVVQQLHK